MTDDSNRIEALDFLRGLAVMGILLANMVAFGLPSAAQLNPYTLGNAGPLDLAAWTFNFLLVDGKFRALFALMFGASMLLVMESAELDGRDGYKAHRRRMFWLLIIGLAHHLLIWSGDILLPLAVAGLIATWLARHDTLTLIKWALALLALQWVIDLAAVLPPFWQRSAALAPDASAGLLEQWQAFADSYGGAGSQYLADQMARHQLGYGGVVAERFASLGHELVNMALYSLPETLAFMTLGMAMLKGGFLSAQWTAEQYRATWKRAYLVGLVPMAGLAVWVLLTADPVAAEAASFGWALPLRLPLAAAHAAMALAIAIQFPDARLVRAVRSIGRLALSNYLLCSLIGASLFNRYGLGLFGQIDRAGLLLMAVVGWGAMLLWSPLWRRYFPQGPAEWAWRRLARGRA